MMISDLRYDLEQVPELEAVNIAELPDAMVLLLHDQFSTASHDNAPAWLVSLLSTWVALERDAAVEYEARDQRKDAIIQELQARLGYDGYAQAGD